VSEAGAKWKDRLSVVSDESRLEQAKKALLLFKLFMGALMSISLIVGGIGIMNVMLASVSQRTREIGVRMAVGASPGAIRLQFLGEAVLLTTLSGGIGVAVGVLAANPLSHAVGWQLAMSTRVDVLSFVFAIAVGVCFGMYPAVRASSLDPIAALRVE
jgi:putative ABC transport system permease protein